MVNSGVSSNTAVLSFLKNCCSKCKKEIPKKETRTIISVTRDMSAETVRKKYVQEYQSPEICQFKEI